MTSDIEQNDNRRRKLLVPIVVLMLCAVAIIGVAYAANSSLTVSNNTIDTGAVSIDYTTDPELAFGNVDDTEAFSVDFVQNSTYDGKEYTKTVAATAAGQNTVSLKASEDGNVTVRLTTDSASAADIQKVLDGVSVKVGETVQTAAINGAAVTFAITAGTTTDFDFSLDLADGAEAISGSATDLSDAVSNAKFTVVFTLEPASA